MSDSQSVTFAADLRPEAADRDITRAVSARHKIAHSYVLRLRKRNPEATPSEIVEVLERQYIWAITVAGGIMTAGTIAANVGLALIPGVAAGKEAGKGAAKVAAKSATKKVATRAAAKQVARGAATTGAERVVLMLPAGEEQLQFEITAIFALALADIHSLDYDRDQAHALVYGLSNGRVSQDQINAMAADLVADPAASSGIAQSIVSGRTDWSHWAETLASSLPGGAAQDLVRTVQTGQLETTRSGITEREQNAVEYGVGALVGGVTRFVFGREVVDASKTAFPAPPGEFPDHLANVHLRGADAEVESGRAIAALEDAARATSSWLATAADTSTRAFRRVDIDGDGVPDEPQALTAVKGAGGAIAGAVSSGARVFRRVDVDGDGVPDAPPALTALRGASAGVTGRLRRKPAANTSSTEGGDVNATDPRSRDQDESALIDSDDSRRRNPSPPSQVEEDGAALGQDSHLD